MAYMTKEGFDQLTAQLKHMEQIDIALNNLLDIKDIDINEAYVFCSSNLFVKDKVVYYPIYMIAFFEQVQVEDKVFKLDLSGLK